MMRRRKKDQRGPRRPPRHEEPVALPVPQRSRRRARPHTPVPAQLQVREGSPVILVTGFDPFGGERVNPSWDVCRELPKEIAGHRVETLKVPCRFRASIEAVAAAIERLQPAIVLCLGQAGGRAHLTVERVAINVDDARIGDNGGSRPVDEPIARDGPAAYFATLPIKAMAAAIRAAGVPAHVSNSAGTYVCNHLMYGVLHFLAARSGATRAGFMHLPYAEAQVLDKPGVPALSLASMARGVEAAIVAACAHREDIKTAEGALD